MESQIEGRTFGILGEPRVNVLSSTSRLTLCSPKFAGKVPDARDECQRASPDALLARAGREGRGQLKIFLGAAPGVGKTYAMLSSARPAKAEGRDVVVGLVETHGRAETEALTGRSRSPAAQADRYETTSSRSLTSTRRWRASPACSSSTNTPTPTCRASPPQALAGRGGIAAAGIDVWTTLNIQHLESLNDVVAENHRGPCSRDRARHRARSADEIVLVDLPPDELIERLAEGKVYVQDTARAGRGAFFKPRI